MNSYVLSEEQQNALDVMKDFIRDKPSACCITIGRPGTGKSLTISKLTEYLNSAHIPYCLCAPTHKAALVMQRYSGEAAMTIHKLLSLSPKLDIFELDFKDLLFVCKGGQMQIPRKGVVVLDEISMVSDSLYELLIKKCSEQETVICGFGDIKQLQAVDNRPNQASKIFKATPCTQLTKVFRQKDESKVIPVLEILRENPLSVFKTDIGTNGSLITTRDRPAFVKVAINQFQKAIDQQDVLLCKVTAYTNKTVNLYNQVIHRALCGDEEYKKGEFLTCYENVEINNFKFFNSMDYIIFEIPIKTEIWIPTLQSVEGWRLRLYDPLEKKIGIINMISRNTPNEVLMQIADRIEDARTSALSCKNKINAKKLWKLYYQITGAFCTPVDLVYEDRVVKKKTFDYGYAATIHKLQGSSLDNIFIDMYDVNSCLNQNAKRQLQYVAVSRCRKNAVIFQ